MEKSTYLSLIIPVYNEEENIALLHERIRRVLREQDFSFEIIYVDDGSIDGTFAQLQAVALQDVQVRVIQLKRNYGQTAALAAGIDASVGEILVFMDGDLQNDPIDIPRLLAKLDEGYDIVSGWRKNRQDAEISRKLPSMLANRLISKVTGIHLHDYGCTLKAYRRDVFQHLHLYGEMHRFLPAYAALGGASIAELEVAHHPRQHGVSKYGISRTIRVMLDLITLKFLGRYGTRPMHAFGQLGLISMLLGSVLWLVSLGRTLFMRDHHASYIARMSANFLSFVKFGIQCLMMGVSAELLVRIYYEAQGKAIYVVRTTFPRPQAKAGKHEAA